MATAADELLDFDLAHQQVRVRAPMRVDRPGKAAVFLARHTLFREAGQRAGEGGWLDYRWLTTLAGTSDISGAELLAQLGGGRNAFAHHQAGGFERYYDQFLQNSLRGRRFEITLRSGEVAQGIPTAGSVANPSDPNAAFSFRDDAGRVLRIPFGALRDAAPVDNVLGIVRTMGQHIVSANDLMIEVPRETASGLLVAPYAVFIVFVKTGTWLDKLPQLYKFVTVEGAEFSIASISTMEKHPSARLQLVAEPAR